MLFLTILLAGITVSAVSGDDIGTSLSSAPMASIKMEHVEGGLPGYPTYVEFKKNFLYLKHMGGEPLPADSIEIIVSGEGSSYTGVVGHGGSTRYGDVLISYNDLLFDGKTSQYALRNPALSDGMWSAGENLILNGDDSIDGSSASSVSVSINAIANTSNNYGLKDGSWITVKVFDKKSQCIISELECQVYLAK